MDDVAAIYARLIFLLRHQQMLSVIGIFEQASLKRQELIQNVIHDM